MVTKEDFAIEVEGIEKKIDIIKTKLGDTINTQEFNDIIRILERKFSSKKKSSNPETPV